MDIPKIQTTPAIIGSTDIGLSETGPATSADENEDAVISTQSQVCARNRILLKVDTPLLQIGKQLSPTDRQATKHHMPFDDSHTRVQFWAHKNGSALETKLMMRELI